MNLGAQEQAGNPLDQNASLSGSQRKVWTFKVSKTLKRAEVVEQP